MRRERLIKQLLIGLYASDFSMPIILLSLNFLSRKCHINVNEDNASHASLLISTDTFLPIHLAIIIDLLFVQMTVRLSKKNKCSSCHMHYISCDMTRHFDR